MNASTTIPANERSIRIGGLLRCCIASIQKSVRPSEPGTYLDCQWCKGEMVVDEGGAWRWVRPSERTQESKNGA
jgi:hypothetical protein